MKIVGISGSPRTKGNTDLLILPHLSITSNDFTKSVLVFTGCEMTLEGLEGETLYITDISASSAALIKIILALKDIRVNIQQFGAQMPELKPGEAALLIGDSALRAVGKYRIIADLGNEWKKLTGRKMVYAYGLCRKNMLAMNRRALSTFWIAC